MVTGLSAQSSQNRHGRTDIQPGLKKYARLDRVCDNWGWQRVSTKTKLAVCFDCPPQNSPTEGDGARPSLRLTSSTLPSSPYFAAGDTDPSTGPGTALTGGSRTYPIQPGSACPTSEDPPQAPKSLVLCALACEDRLLAEGCPAGVQPRLSPGRNPWQEHKVGKPHKG
jgi:hypothetical protein